MKKIEFVSYLQNLGVKLWMEQEQLRYRSPKGVMTPELKQDIVDRKTEILELLREAQKTQKSNELSLPPHSTKNTERTITPIFCTRKAVVPQPTGRVKCHLQHARGNSCQW